MAETETAQPAGTAEMQETETAIGQAEEAANAAGTVEV
jgi:hypothetical protein